MDMDFTIQDFITEDEEMVSKHGYGSVYFNNKRGCYQAAFYVNELDSNGKKKRKIISGKTYEDVMLKLAQLRSGEMAFFSDTPVNVPAPVAVAAPVQYHKIKDIWAEILKSKKGLKSSSYRWYNDMGNVVTRLIGDIYIEKLTTSDIVDFQLNCQHKENGKLSSDKRIKELNNILKNIIDLAIDKGYITKNPYNKKMSRPQGYVRDQRENVYTLEEVNLILDKLYYSDLMVLKTITPLLFMSGLRISEMLALQYSDLDKSNGVIKVHQQVVGVNKIERKLGSLKGKENTINDRVVPVPPIFFDIVENWQAYRKKKGYIKRAALKGNEDIIFANSRGELRCNNTVRKDLQEFLEGIGLRREGTAFHGFRRTYATFMSRAGVDEPIISKLLGHKDADGNGACAVARQHYILPDNSKEEMKKKEALGLFMGYVGSLFEDNVDLEYIKINA